MPPNFEPQFGFSTNDPSFFEIVFSPNAPAFGSVSLTPISIWYWSAPTHQVQNTLFFLAAHTKQFSEVDSLDYVGIFINVEIVLSIVTVDNIDAPIEGFHVKSYQWYFPQPSWIPVYTSRYWKTQQNVTYFFLYT